MIVTLKFFLNIKLANGVPTNLYPPVINTKNVALNQTWLDASKTIFSIIEERVLN